MADKKEPEVSIREVPPDLAAKWIQSNHERQRSKKLHKIAQYANDQRANKWPLSTCMILFDTDGNLINGQNTLEACVQSRKTIKVVVGINWPKQSILVCDSGVKRSTDDQFQMAGKDWPRGCGATVRVVLGCGSMGGGNHASDMQVMEFMQSHGERVAFVHYTFTKNPLATAVVKGVAARVLVGKFCREEKITRFAEVLKSGIMNPGEDGAVKLRNWMIDLKAKKAGILRKNLYGVAERAFRAFIDAEKLQYLHIPKEELFPIPEDKVLGK